MLNIIEFDSHSTSDRYPFLKVEVLAPSVPSIQKMPPHKEGHICSLKGWGDRSIHDLLLNFS